VANTPDGCRWMLSVRGNTAELDPPTQTCQVTNGTVSRRYWAIVSDGEHDNSAMPGWFNMNGQQTNLYLFIGSLTKATTDPDT
jgi:hypothetical protein